MFERGSDWGASLAALTPNKSFLSISFTTRRVVGQSTATNTIVPYVYMYQSGLAPTGRPAGVFRE